jgi:gamma-glutamylcyclotransferase (GGCT)/AIG2-like uncharacterized protein YtfP
MSETLFVYGTLHPGRAPVEISSAVKRLKKIGEGDVRGKLLDLGDYPGLILGNAGGNKVRGSVFLLPKDPKVLAELDSYEEYRPESPASSLFLRKRVNVSLDDGTSRECWIYTYNADRLKRRSKVPSRPTAASSGRMKRSV